MSKYDTWFKNIFSFRESQYDCLCIKYVCFKKFIAGGYMNGSVALHNSKNLKKELVLADTETENINNAVTCISYDHNSTNNLLTCTYSGGLVKLWDYFTGYCMHTIKEKRQTYGVVYHAKRPKFFTYGDDGNILLYDAETRKKEFVYSKSERNILDGHVSKIFTMRFNPNSPNEFLSGGWDNTMYYWDVRCQNSIKYISNIFMAGDGILINNQGTEIITCEWIKDDPLKQWDYASGKLIQIIKPDMEYCQLYCGKLIADHTIAVGGSDSNIFRLINLKSNSTISYVKGLASGVYSLDTLETSSKKSSTATKYDELVDLPVITFASGKNIYEIRYK